MVPLRTYRIALLLSLAGLSVTVPSRSPAQSAGEYEVKAAFLYNFAKFVEWPAGAGNEIVIGVAGNDGFATVLERITRGKMIGSRSIVIRHLADVSDTTQCHILFIPEINDRWGLLIRQFGDAGVLTVSDQDGFAERGGTIQLYTEGKTIRFMVNIESAERGGLRISSRLLSLAKMVKSQKGRN